MNKCSPEKLKDAADDLQGWLHRHQDVVRVEPEITRMVTAARDKAYEKWRRVSTDTASACIGQETDKLTSIK